MDPKLLELLVCPVTKGPLTYDRDKGELISRSARLAYPVRDGIPVMLEAEARALNDDELAALFVDPGQHRSGVGRSLVAHALARGARRLSVNEDNPGARAFYERLGFQAVGRAETDDAGRPYPLILMAIDADPA